MFVFSALMTEWWTMHARLTTQATTKVAILSALIAHSEKSQRAIARDAGMSASHLNRILSGAVNPTDRTFLQVVQATGARRATVGLALIVGPDNMPLLAQSDFLTRLLADLPAQLLERLGNDVIDADPRWATGIIDYVVTKTEETMARKRKAETEFKVDL